MEMLRFCTVGSVDDGKSTLIGRMLYDAKSIFEDQWEAVERVSENRGDAYTDLALTPLHESGMEEHGLDLFEATDASRAAVAKAKANGPRRPAARKAGDRPKAPPIPVEAPLAQKRFKSDAARN